MAVKLRHAIHFIPKWMTSITESEEEAIGGTAHIALQRDSTYEDSSAETLSSLSEGAYSTYIVVVGEDTDDVHWRETAKIFKIDPKISENYAVGEWKFTNFAYINRDTGITTLQKLLGNELFNKEKTKLFRETIKKINEANKSENFDTISPRVIEIAQNVWEQVLLYLNEGKLELGSELLNKPMISPCIDGSIDIHFINKSVDLLINIPDNTGEFYISSENHRGESFETVLTLSTYSEKLREWLQKSLLK